MTFDRGTPWAAEIVVVDDEEGHAELVRRNLRRAGIDQTITPLTRGDAALRYLFERADRPAGAAPMLVLLDVKMPGRMDGVEVLRQLRRHAATRLVPVIMLTTSDDPRDVRRCYDLGCNLYVIKPVQPAGFVEAVRRLGQFLQVARFPGGMGEGA